MLRSIFVFGVGAALGVYAGGKLDAAVGDKLAKTPGARAFQRTAFEAGSAAAVIMLASRMA